MKPRQSTGRAAKEGGAPASAASRAREDSLAARVFAMASGTFFGLALLKFGNPPIMEKFVEAPTTIEQFLLAFPWPISWAYTMLAIVCVAGLAVIRLERSLPRWIVFMPFGWAIWQVLSATRTIDPALTGPTLAHLLACAVCFYLGLLCLGRLNRLGFFWAGLAAGFFLMLAAGWEQHFGGLRATRDYFWAYIYPDMKEVPPEYIKKISSARIFATLFYPNALAGALLLLTPAVLLGTWRLGGKGRMTPAARGVLCGLVAVASLACLYWSGSKGGWLLMLFLVLVLLLHAPISRQVKLGIIGVVLVVGLTGFFWRYAGFFQRGATSVAARFDYWQAALRTAASNPVLGTGPGTFAIPYAAIKRPESEMSRLVHNDYLQQASDCGIPSALGYTLFIVAALLFAHRRLAFPRDTVAASLPIATALANFAKWLDSEEGTAFSVWLGVLGWALQCCFEFGLYIPALAWLAFAFLGWLLSRPASGI